MSESCTVTKKKEERKHRRFYSTVFLSAVGFLIMAVVIQKYVPNSHFKSLELKIKDVGKAILPVSIFNPEFARFVRLIDSAKTPNVMQKMMQDNRILTHLKRNLKLVMTHPPSGRTCRLVMTAFLMSKFPVSMFGNQQTKQEMSLIASARRICSKILKYQNIDAEYSHYEALFKDWHEKDRHIVLDRLVNQYVDLERGLLKTDPKDRLLKKSRENAASRYSGKDSHDRWTRGCGIFKRFINAQ